MSIQYFICYYETLKGPGKAWETHSMDTYVRALDDHSSWSGGQVLRHHLGSKEQSNQQDDILEGVSKI